MHNNVFEEPQPTLDEGSKFLWDYSKKKNKSDFRRSSCDHSLGKFYGLCQSPQNLFADSRESSSIDPDREDLGLGGSLLNGGYRGKGNYDLHPKKFDFNGKVVGGLGTNHYKDFGPAHIGRKYFL